jgi:hypothetical protein
VVAAAASSSSEVRIPIVVSPLRRPVSALKRRFDGNCFALLDKFYSSWRTVSSKMSVVDSPWLPIPSHHPWEEISETVPGIT